MAVTIHNTTFTAGGASAAVRVLVHTATVGSCILIWTHSNETGSISAVGVGGIAATRLGAVDGGGSRSELWGLTAPAAGDLTISARFVGTQQSRWGLAATTIVGHRQIGGDPFGTFVAATASSDTVNLSVSSTSTDLVVFGFGVSGAAAVTLNNGSLVLDMSHSTVGRLVIGTIAGAEATSISATAAASSTWGLMALPIVAATIPNVVFDNAAETSTLTPSNTKGLLLTATSGACLLVVINTGSGVDSASAVNIGTTQLTKLGQVIYREAGGTIRTELWGLTAAPSGVLTISAVLAAGGSTIWAMGAATYVGQRATSPFGSVVTGSASATVNASLIVSASTDSLVALFYGTADGNVSLGPGQVARLSTTAAFPQILIADAPGALAITASAVQGNAAANCYWGNIGINIFPAEEATGTSGTAAFTDPADTFAATGQIIVSGSLSATDPADTFAAPAKVIIRGSATATDPPDTFAAPTKVRVSGAFSATDPADTFAASGYLPINGTFAATDAQDTFAATGQIIIQGAVNATDAPDQFSASGNVLGGTITGTFLATDTSDQFAATAAVRVSGLATFTDPADTFAAAAQVIVSSTFTATDAPDTFAASGTSYAAPAFITGTFIATDAPDQFSAPGYVVVTGDFNATDPGDTFAANGTSVATIVGVFSATDSPDTFLALANNISSPAAAVVTIQDGGSGGGGSKRKQRKPPYIRAPEDFWDVRERHLKSLQPEMVESAEPAETPTSYNSPANVIPPQLQSYRIERTSLISKLQQAPDQPRLYNHTRRLKVLNSRIAEQKRLQLELALQKHREEVLRKRARAAKLKKAVKLLALARALSTLTYLYGKL